MQADLIGQTSVRYGAALQKQITRIRRAESAGFMELSQIGAHLTLAYADAANAMMRELAITPDRVSCIAAHGQTLFHAPPITIQWLDPALLAYKTGCPVVSDFRRADCARAGQGAPLVPFADYILFRSDTLNRVLLNIGGIANITWLPAGGSPDDVIAFDTGPGNCISDALTQQHFGKPYDPSGKLAAQGEVVYDIVRSFLRNSYFKASPPKSTDGPAMLSVFENATRFRDSAPVHLLATACALTARTIADAIKRLPGKVDEIIAAGGGTRNKTLRAMLQKHAGLPVRLTDEFGIQSDAREAMAFALLGAATLDGIPSNMPSVTGASSPAILGSITPRPL
jgi:anhydro-N-acetylmuramic acid kinase